MKQITQATIEEALKDDEQLTKAAARFAQQLAKSESAEDVADFVDKLGFALTSTSIEVRVSGTRLLSAVLGQVPGGCLSAIQLEFLARFYADRLKDHHNVIPAVIDGIGALAVLEHLPPTSVSQLLRSFFQHTTCQSQVRSDRAKLYAIFKRLSQRYSEELTAMGGDFVYGLINSLDGERDPRNLDFIFSFMPAVLAQLPLLHLAEEMFEIFACYFPIDFNASLNDPDSITRDQLSAKLAQCLVAAPAFVEWTVALALEKLESDLLVAKLDALELLQQAALKFVPAQLEPHFESIWTALKVEIFPGSADSAEVVQMGLQTLRALLEQAAAATPAISRNWQTIVLGQILGHLSEPSQRLFRPAAAIALVCVAGDAVYASDKILNSFAITLETHASPPHAHIDVCIQVYALLAQLFKIAALRCDNHLERINSGAVCDALQAHLIAALRPPTDVDTDTVAAEENADLQRAALGVFNECVPLIGEANRALLYQSLVRLITHPSSDLAFTHLVEQLGALHPIELQSHCIDACTRQLTTTAGQSVFVRRKVFSNLLPLCKQMAFAERVLDLVLAHVFQSDAGGSDDAEGRLLALEALNALLAGEDSRFVVELQHNTDLIARLVRLARQQEQRDGAVLAQIASALAAIVQRLPVAEQYAIVTEYLPQLELNCGVAAPAELCVCHGLLAQLDKCIALDDHYERLLAVLTAVALDSAASAAMSSIAQQLLCRLVNSSERNAANGAVLVALVKRLQAAVETGVSSERAVDVLAWLAKGQVVRGADEAADIVGSLACLLSHETLATPASRAFEIITADEPQSLHLPNTQFLYKQKFFHLALRLLGAGLDARSPQPQHLSAFVFVMQATPLAVIKLHMARIAPLLFHCLAAETQRAETLCSALTICERLMAQQQPGDDYLRGQLQQLIPSCLRLAVFKDSMAVRLGALRLLHALVDAFPVYVLLPHKTDVVLALAAPLDDSKRLVRNTAVQTRNAWYLIGTTSAA